MADRSKKRREDLSNVLFGFSDPLFCLTEQVKNISIEDLYQFKDHPFRVLDDEKMQETVESIRQHGILVPGLARPREGGGYEIIAGHRRTRGAELAGITEVPFIVRNYTDDEAIIIMVDSNIQRENLLPSEKAFAYKMKNDALKHQGKKSDKSTYEIVGDKAGDNAKTVQRYIRLTELHSGLLEMIDSNKLGIIVGVELSFLKKEEQLIVYELLSKTGKKLTVEQAECLKRDSQDGKFDIEVLEGSTIPKKKSKGLKLKAKWRAEFFNDNDSDEEIEKVIYELLCQWKNNRG